MRKLGAEWSVSCALRCCCCCCCCCRCCCSERPRRLSVRPPTRNLRYETTPAGDQSKCTRQPGKTARRHRRSRPVRQPTPFWAPDVPKPTTHMSRSPLQRSRRPLLPRRTSLFATGTNSHPRPATRLLIIDRPQAQSVICFGCCRSSLLGCTQSSKRRR